MAYLVIFIAGILITRFLVKLLFRAAAGLQTASMPYLAYRAVTDRKAAEEAVREGTGRVKAFLDGKEVDLRKIDLSEYAVSVDPDTGTVTLSEKKFPVREAAEKAAGAVGDFIMGER